MKKKSLEELDCEIMASSSDDSYKKIQEKIKGKSKAYNAM